jgi:uncharacterized protein DUF349
MSFLDRFKPQPRWKHADPAIRASAIAEIPGDADGQATLAELASTDEDVRVRRAAVAHLSGVEDLVRLASTERDEDLRRELAERLIGVATAPTATDGAAALALGGLSDPKHLAAVAKASPHETVRTAALGQIHDARILAGVARQAEDPQTALDAVTRVADPAELVNIALKTDHKDAGIAALERAAEAAAVAGEGREALENIAGRAKNKSVAKRARALLQAIDEAEAARRAALEQWQQRVAAAMARVEALAAAPSAPDARAQLAEAEQEWRELAATEALQMDTDTAARFGALMGSATEAIETHERMQAERRAEEERREALLRARISLCERVEAARGDAALDEVDKARAEWEGLPPAGPEELQDAQLHARFAEACRRALERHDKRQEIDRTRARLDELAADADRLAGQDDLSEDSWTAVAGEWKTLSSTVDEQEIGEAVRQRYADAEARVRQREIDRRTAAERTARQQVQRIDQLIDRVLKRATAEDLTLREADRAMRELRTAIEAPLPVDEREQHVLLERLKVAQAAIAPRLHELREMDEWKRFANAAVQEELIARTEALRAKHNFDAPEGLKPEEIEAAARELHDIQERWKQVAEAPRAQAQALWHRYRQAADPIQAKARDFFAHRAEERKQNLDRKMALIERAEALADSTDWVKTAEELKKLQHGWQQLGPVPRQDTRATWKRFREACDRFFTRRNEDLAQRKETWSTNLARKEALCARAEELLGSREWDKAAAEIRRLQAEWKTIGPVRRNKSEAIWQRFRAACDAFFERYRRRDEIDLETKHADREALVMELESLAPASDPESQAAPDSLLDRVRSLRTRWNQTTPVVRHGADPLSARFVEAFERVMASYPASFKGTELDVDASRQKMEKLCARVEAMTAEAPAAPANSSQALADMLREALAANTIGGRGGEEAKWRSMAEDVRQAQSAFSRLGPVPGSAGRDLTERFHKACNRFFDQYRRRVPQQAHQRGAKPVGAR